MPEEDDFDDSSHRDALDHEHPPDPPQEVVNKLLDRYSKYEGEQLDWYRALIAVNTDKYAGDWSKIIPAADEAISEHPTPPTHI